MGMPIRSYAALLVLVAACSHSPAPVADLDPEPGPVAGDRPLAFRTEDDEEFLDQSLALALFPWDRQRVAGDLRRHIGSRSKGGTWEVPDAAVSRSRKLSLQAVRTETLLPLTDGTASVCVDFVDDNGDRVDVDFNLERSDAGSAERIGDFEIHRVNGKARYTYLEKEGAWTRSARLTTP